MCCSSTERVFSWFLLSLFPRWSYKTRAQSLSGTPRNCAAETPLTSCCRRERTSTSRRGSRRHHRARVIFVLIVSLLSRFLFGSVRCSCTIERPFHHFGLDYFAFKFNQKKFVSPDALVCRRWKICKISLGSSWKTCLSCSQLALVEHYLDWLQSSWDFRWLPLLKNSKQNNLFNYFLKKKHV